MLLLGVWVHAPRKILKICPLDIESVTENFKVVKLILGGYNHPIHLHWTTPSAWSRGCGGCKFLKGIYYYYYLIKYRNNNLNSIFSYQYIIFGFPDMVLKGGHLTPMTLPWICLWFDDCVYACACIRMHGELYVR